MEDIPSLEFFITSESWLIFDILEQSSSECKWMLFPPDTWSRDPDFKKFQTFVKNLAVVNDASERSVKLVQETVSQTLNEKKLQKMLLVKSSLEKPKSRTKKSYREAANQLSAAEQLDIAFGLSKGEEQEISSCSELDSSMDIVNDADIVEELCADMDD